MCLPPFLERQRERRGRGNIYDRSVELKAAEAHKNGGRRARSPAADDLDGVVTAALLVSALPAHGETALAQRRPVEAQLVVVEKLGFLHQRDTAGRHRPGFLTAGGHSAPNCVTESSVRHQANPLRP